MPDISVVVPTFNRAPLIGETLDAILAQTLGPDEIIVVDDGSTDDTADVLARYASKIRVLWTENAGDMVARNIGLRAATGRLVAFCDSDDLWEPGFLRALSSSWHHAPAQTAAYTDFREMRDGHLSPTTKFDRAPEGFWTGARRTAPSCEVFDEPIVARLLAFQPFFPSCMMVNRALFESLGGWDETVSRIIGCDFATALRVANAPPIGVVRQPLVRIRKHATNISADVEAMNLGDALVLDRALKSRPELSPFAGEFGASIVKRRLQALDSAFARRDFAAVQSIDRLLPRSSRSLKQLTKTVIAKLPGSVRSFLADLASRPPGFAARDETRSIDRPPGG